MTPKEKAKELVDKFKPYMYPFAAGSAYLTGTRDDEALLKDAKTCASMVADEMLHELFDMTPITKGEWKEFFFIKTEYWEDVKQRLKNVD